MVALLMANRGLQTYSLLGVGDGADSIQLNRKGVGSGGCGPREEEEKRSRTEAQRRALVEIR
jgi:hypothetical protein